MIVSRADELCVQIDTEVSRLCREPTLCPKHPDISQADADIVQRANLGVRRELESDDQGVQGRDGQQESRSTPTGCP